MGELNKIEPKTRIITKEDELFKKLCPTGSEENIYEIIIVKGRSQMVIPKRKIKHYFHETYGITKNGVRRVENQYGKRKEEIQVTFRFEKERNIEREKYKPKETKVEIKGLLTKMASLMRIISRQGCRVLTRQSTIKTCYMQPNCFVSTTKKKKGDANDFSADLISDGKQVEHFKETDDNWMSYGYSLTDREYDRVGHNLILFIGITLVICWGGFFIAYLPDHRMRHWAQREGYLELARREREGLPLIDGELVEPSKIELPSDEELGDYNIII